MTLKTKADHSRKDPSKSPTGHFFCLDLRSHHLGYLDLAQPKAQKGIYFTTLEKENSANKFIREHSIIDYDDGRNEGLISDRLVETSKGYEIRQIISVNPTDGVEYRYLTNEKTLPA